MPIFTREDVDKCFEGQTQQHTVLINLYKMVGIDLSDSTIEKVEGFPVMGQEIGKYIWKRCIEFDQIHHPKVLNGGLFLNNGFSTDNTGTLTPWEISYDEAIIKWRIAG